MAINSSYLFEEYEMAKQLGHDREFWLFCNRETNYKYFDTAFPYCLYKHLYTRYYMSPGELYKVPSDLNSHEADKWRYALMQASEDDVHMTAKDTNPKDAVGVAKVPASTIPAQVLGELGLAMMEGALKYGRHNYRIAGVRASVYYDAALRHLIAWQEGEDIDPESDINHVTKAIASLVVLRDAMMQDNWIDDRPPPAKNKNWIMDLNRKAKALLIKYPNPKPAFTKKDVK